MLIKSQVTPGQPFKILVANFDKNPERLLSNQVVSIALEHPNQLVESDYPHGELLGVVDEEQMYCKRQLNLKDVDSTNRQLADDHETSNYDKKDDFEDITVENIKLEVDEKYHFATRDMLHKHQHILSGEHGDSNISKNPIYLVPGSRPSKSALYHARPKTRELPKSGFSKQLDSSVI